MHRDRSGTQYRAERDFGGAPHGAEDRHDGDPAGPARGDWIVLLESSIIQNQYAVGKSFQEFMIMRGDYKRGAGCAGVDDKSDQPLEPGRVHAVCRFVEQNHRRGGRHRGCQRGALLFTV